MFRVLGCAGRSECLLHRMAHLPFGSQQADVEERQPRTLHEEAGVAGEMDTCVNDLDYPIQA
jgi:hypothetical protein